MGPIPLYGAMRPDDPVPAATLVPWFRSTVPGVAPGPLLVERIAGGHSNLTYRITDAAGTRWALRRPPTGMVLATAHDMAREWRFLCALAPTPVPVAEPVALCTDPAVIGTEFYVTGFVEGAVLGDEVSGHHLAHEARRAAGLDAVDVLVALHAVDPHAVGLGDLERPGSYLERQLRRWYRQVHASAVPDLAAVDAAHELLSARVARLPVSEVRIAHGDFRMGNLAVGPDGRVRAVFDWELAALGDPLADLGWLIASWCRPGDPDPPMLRGPSLAPGWAEASELVERYAARSGRDVGGLGFYVAFARWRSACIGAGVWSRYAAGVMDGDEPAEVAGQRLAGLQAQARSALDALRGR